VDLKQKITDICRDYGIADMYGFGSRSQEVAELLNTGASPVLKPGSDLDIGVLPVKSKTWNPEKRVNLSIELEDLFHVTRVDLVLLPEADPYLALDIIRGELLFSNDPDRQARYELFVLRRAGDLLPFKKERIRMILYEGAR
jgi:predicted nucleotidyltransferase